MSVRLSVCIYVRFREKRDFLAPIKDKALIFCVHIPLVYEHLFYKYIVRRSVGQATKGKRASLLIDVFILVFIKNINKKQLILILFYFMYSYFICLAGRPWTIRPKTSRHIKTTFF